MSFSVTYDAEVGLIAIIVKGAIDHSVVREIAAEVARLAQEHGCGLVLTDTRETTLTLSVTDLYDLPKIIAKMLAELGLPVPGLKRALVVPDALDDFAFFETVSRNRGQNVMLFRDMDEAKKWLTGN
jgi:hypothetical protein